MESLDRRAKKRQKRLAGINSNGRQVAPNPTVGSQRRQRRHGAGTAIVVREENEVLGSDDAVQETSVEDRGPGGKSIFS